MVSRRGSVRDTDERQVIAYKMDVEKDVGEYETANLSVAAQETVSGFSGTQTTAAPLTAFAGNLDFQVGSHLSRIKRATSPVIKDTLLAQEIASREGHLIMIIPNDGVHPNSFDTYCNLNPPGPPRPPPQSTRCQWVRIFTEPIYRKPSRFDASAVSRSEVSLEVEENYPWVADPFFRGIGVPNGRPPAKEPVVYECGDCYLKTERAWNEHSC